MTAEAELARERHRNLDIWKNAVAFTARICKLTRTFPHECLMSRLDVKAIPLAVDTAGEDQCRVLRPASAEFAVRAVARLAHERDRTSRDGCELRDTAIMLRCCNYRS